MACVLRKGVDKDREAVCQRIREWLVLLFQEYIPEVMINKPRRKGGSS